MHRFGEKSEEAVGKGTRRIVVQPLGTPREQAEDVVYRDEKGFYFPGTWVFGALCEAGAGHKLKGSRRSARFIVPAAVRVVEEKIRLLNGDGKSPIGEYEVDSRPVTIPATKGRVMRHRPRFDQWHAAFTVRINDELLPVDFVNQLLVEAGDQIGIGDFRPQKRGPFGTFTVERWQVQ
jgi:hypothetical protein